MHGTVLLKTSVIVIIQTEYMVTKKGGVSSVWYDLLGQTHLGHFLDKSGGAASILRIFLQAFA
jgi:hypothetical protein